MGKGSLVVDGVAHAYSFEDENPRPGAWDRTPDAIAPDVRAALAERRRLLAVASADGSGAR